jgi:capsular polysaccharide biosynthesis protein
MAMADVARAVVTSPSQVAVALAAAHVQRDPEAVAGCDVNVQVLGSSNIFELTVTDESPTAAAAVANSLASGLIQQQVQAYRGQQVKLITDLESQLQNLNSQGASLDTQIYGLASRAASQAQGVDRFNASAVAAAAAHNANTLAALRAQRADVAQEINTLTVERQSLLANSAQPAAPSVIDPAVAPDEPNPGSRSEYLLLGLLLGAVIGLGLAALLEAFRPTVVGHADVARALGVPMLGYLQPAGGKS